MGLNISGYNLISDSVTRGQNDVRKKIIDSEGQSIKIRQQGRKMKTKYVHDYGMMIAQTFTDASYCLGICHCIAYTSLGWRKKRKFGECCY